MDLRERKVGAVREYYHGKEFEYSKSPEIDGAVVQPNRIFFFKNIWRVRAIHKINVFQNFILHQK